MTAQIVPLAGGDQYLAVMARADWQCQCTRSSHAHFRKNPGGRCMADGHTGPALIAGPASPGPDPARTLSAVPPDELVAWCAPCWDGAVAAARKQARAAQRLGGDQSGGEDQMPLF